MAIGSIQAGVSAAQSAMPQRSQQLGQSIQQASSSAAAAFSGIMQRKQAEEDRIDQTKGALLQSYSGETATEGKMYDGHYKVLDAMGNSLVSDEMLSWASESSENQGRWLGMLKQYQDKVASAENLWLKTNEAYNVAKDAPKNPTYQAELDKSGLQLDSAGADTFLNTQFLALNEDLAGKDSQVQIDMDDLKNGKLNFTVTTPQNPSVVFPTGDEEVSFGPESQYIDLDQQNLNDIFFESEENLMSFNLVRNGYVTEKPPLTIAGAVQTNSLNVAGGLKGDELEENINGAMDANEAEVLNWYFNSGEGSAENERTRQDINSILQNRDQKNHQGIIKQAKEEFLGMYKDSYIDQGRGEKAPKFTGTTTADFQRTMTRTRDGSIGNVFYMPPIVENEVVQLNVSGAVEPAKIVSIDYSNPINPSLTYINSSGNRVTTSVSTSAADDIFKQIEGAISGYSNDGGNVGRALKAFDEVRASLGRN
jgi:hypothetical protein